MWQQFFLQKLRIVSPKVKAQGVLPYKSDGGACQKILRTNVSQIHFHPWEVPVQQQQIM